MSDVGRHDPGIHPGCPRPLCALEVISGALILDKISNSWESDWSI